MYFHCGTCSAQSYFCMCQAWHLPPLLFKSSCDISISFSFVVLSNLSSSNAWNATHASTFRSLWVTSGSISTEGTNFFFWRLCSFAGRKTVFRVLSLVILQHMIWIAEVQGWKGSPRRTVSTLCTKQPTLLAEIFSWHCRSFLGKDVVVHLGGLLKLEEKHTVKCIILIEIFTAHNRPMSPKSFCKSNGLRLQKINCVYSQKKQ